MKRQMGSNERKNNNHVISSCNAAVHLQRCNRRMEEEEPWRDRDKRVGGCLEMSGKRERKRGREREKRKH
jgi:hypothetical protein